MLASQCGYHLREEYRLDKATLREDYLRGIHSISASFSCTNLLVD
jgi:hypothetical protein